MVNVAKKSTTTFFTKSKTAIVSELNDMQNHKEDGGQFKIK